MSVGDATKPATDDFLRKIYRSDQPDFTAQSCNGASFEDLDPQAIAVLRSLLIKKKPDNEPLINALENWKLLEQHELITNEGNITYAALILLGTPAALRRFLPSAELRYWYSLRSDALERQDYENYKVGYLLFHDALWERINRRNDFQYVQEKFVMREFRTFNERVVREAVLNAVMHRDYRSNAEISIHQTPTALKITNPGQISSHSIHILKTAKLRNNNMLADLLEACDLVEQNGFGIDRMIQWSERENRPLSNYEHSTSSTVVLFLDCQIQTEKNGKHLIAVDDDTPIERLIRSEDTAAVLSFQRTRTRPGGGLDWSVQEFRDIVYIPETHDERLANDLRIWPPEEYAWNHALHILTKAAQDLGKRLAGTLHVFINAPYSIGAAFGRLLDEYAKDAPFILYQYSHQDEGWRPFWLSPSKYSLTNAPPITLEFQLLINDPIGKGAVFSLESTHHTQDHQIEEVRIGEGLGSSYRMYIDVQHFIRAPSYSYVIVSQIESFLANWIQQNPGQSIHILTSLPLVAMVELGRFLRPSVFGKVILYRCEKGRYFAELDLMALKPLGQPHRLEIIEVDEGVLYRLDGEILPACRRFPADSLSGNFPPPPETFNWPPVVLERILQREALDIELRLSREAAQMPWELAQTPEFEHILMNRRWTMARIGAPDRYAPLLRPRAGSLHHRLRVVMVSPPSLGSAQAESYRLKSTDAIDFFCFDTDATLEQALTFLKSEPPDVLLLPFQQIHANPLETELSLYFRSSPMMRKEAQTQILEIPPPRILVLSNGRSVASSKTSYPVAALMARETALIALNASLGGLEPVFFEALLAAILGGQRIADAVPQARMAMLNSENGHETHLGVALSCLDRLALGALVFLDGGADRSNASLEKLELS